MKSIAGFCGAVKGNMWEVWSVVDSGGGRGPVYSMRRHSFVRICPLYQIYTKANEYRYGSHTGKVRDGVALYPKDWTLRYTAVKRCRHSDADLRLDILELICPPFVLEMICGETDQVMKKRGNKCFCNGRTLP